MAASPDELKKGQKEEREVLDLLLANGLITDFEHCAGTKRDWESHIDAFVNIPEFGRTSVDLKVWNKYGFVAEHHNRWLRSTGSLHGKQEFFLIHDLPLRRFMLCRRAEVLGLSLSRGPVPDRMKMPRVNDSVRQQPYWAYTGNTLTNDGKGGKKPCFDVVQKIPYAALQRLSSYRGVQL